MFGQNDNLSLHCSSLTQLSIHSQWQSTVFETPLIADIIDGWIDWLIDYLLFNVQQHIFFAYSGREQVQQYLIYIYIYINTGRAYTSEATIVDCHWECIESCVVFHGYSTRVNQVWKE
jgi:hypothetical protein